MTDASPSHPPPQHGTGRAHGARPRPVYGPRPLPLFLEMLRRETEGSPERRAAALRGLRAYQDAPRPPAMPPAPVLDAQGGTVLRDYGGGGGGGGRDGGGGGGPTARAPVVFVPSLINSPAVLDLSPERSLLRWLAARGHRVLLVDWGWPDADARRLDLTGHVERRLLPLLARLEARLGRPAVLAGYCLGGTLALAAAAPARAAGVAAIAAPWHFIGYGDEARAAARRLLADALPSFAASGLVPLEVFQLMFWRIDPGRTVAKYERFGTLDPAAPEAAAFVRLEDWANAGAPLPHAAAAQLLGWIADDDAPGQGRWRVGGAAATPAASSRPGLALVSMTDRIVPARTAAMLRTRRETPAGHIGLMAGRDAERCREEISSWLHSVASECI